MLTDTHVQMQKRTNRYADVLENLSKLTKDCLPWLEKNKDAPKHLYKLTTENVSFFNRDEIFVVRKVIKNSEDDYLYWI